MPPLLGASFYRFRSVAFIRRNSQKRFVLRHVATNDTCRALHPLAQGQFRAGEENFKRACFASSRLFIRRPMRLLDFQDTYFPFSANVSVFHVLAGSMRVRLFKLFSQERRSTRPACQARTSVWVRYLTRDRIWQACSSSCQDDRQSFSTCRVLLRGLRHFIQRPQANDPRDAFANRCFFPFSAPNAAVQRICHHVCCHLRNQDCFHSCSVAHCGECYQCVQR